MADIFISYARADRDRIEKLAAALEAEGYTTWWDRNIDSGAEFSAEIERELEAAKAVVVCWSKEGNQSRWVKDEATIAARAGKLKAVSLDGAEPPIGYMQYHAVDFAGWKGGREEDAFQTLARALGGEAAAEAEPLNLTAPTGKPPEALQLSDPKVWGGALALLAVILISLVVFRGGGEQAAPVETAEAGVDRSKSIAVLPFDDFSADDNEWLADGLTEEILNSLARTPDLLVASRTSSFAYKDTDEEIPAIAKALGVEHIIEGSVRRAGDRLRVTVQLIRASDGFHVWSENYDRDTDDIIAIQEEIAVEIAQALKTAMDPKALADMLSVGTRSTKAYEAYLEGSALSARTGETGDVSFVDRANAAFERARTIDPSFARAHHAAAIVWRTNLTPTTIQSREVGGIDQNYSEFLSRINAAIETETNEAQRHRYLAEKATINFKIKESISHYKAYLEEYPLDAESLGDLARAYVFVGDYPNAQATARRVEELTGDNPNAYSAAIINYVWSKAYGDAARVSREAIAAYPDHALIAYQVHRALLWAGEIDEARALAPRVVELFPSQKEIVELRQACADGDRATAEAAMQEIFANGGDDFAGAGWIAARMLGDDEAAQRITAPYDREKPPYLLRAWLYYPYFDAYAHPNFAAALEREGMERPPASKIPFACPPAETKEASIAVLPFADLSPEGDQEYFSDGIAEEILNVLARVDGLKVASRTSSFAFKDKPEMTARAIANTLGVRHVVEGSVRKAGETVRITAQLIDAETDAHLWSQTFDRTLTVENIFEIQDEISSKIVEELGQNIDLGRANTLRFTAAADTKNLRAYELYLEGRELLPERKLETLPLIIEKFEAAVRLDPNFARGWEALAATYMVLPSYNTHNPENDRYKARAIEAAEKALALNDKLPLAQVAVNSFVYNDGAPDYGLLMEGLNKAVEADPHEALVWSWRGQNLTDTGFFEQGERDLRRAIEIDPSDEVARQWLVRNLLMQRRVDEAHNLYLQGSKNNSQVRTVLALALEANGKEDAARDLIEQDLPPNSDKERLLKAFFSPADDPETAKTEVLDALGPAGAFLTQYGFPNDVLYTLGDYQETAPVEPASSMMVWWYWMRPDYWQSPERYRVMREQGVEAYWREHGFPPQCRMIDPLPDGRDYECD